MPLELLGSDWSFVFEFHNDDPEAASMWMGRGSFWTQPNRRHASSRL